MKSTLFSLTVFLALISFMFFSNHKLKISCNEIISICESLEDTITKKDWETSYNKSIELINSVENNSPHLSIYINHVEFDNILSEAIRLTQYLKTSDIEDSLASIHTIKSLAETILNLQKVRIKNIF